MNSIKKLLISLTLSTYFFSCDEAPFRTPLDDLSTVLKEVPELYAGTFLYANDSVLEAVQSSGLSPEAFLFNILEREGWNMDQKLFSIHIKPGGQEVMYTAVVPFAASRIDSGTYINGEQKIRWHRILDHALEIRIWDEENDTTIQSPVWRMGKLYFIPESTFGVSTRIIDGYKLVNKLEEKPAEETEKWELTPGLLKENAGSHYLILCRDDGLYQINRYQLSTWGFRRSSIREITISEEPQVSETKSFLKDLDAIRKLSPADTLQKMIVLNPSGKHLDKLFQSPYAHTENFIRLNTLEAEAEYSDSLAITFGAAALALLIYIIIKGRRKSTS